MSLSVVIPVYNGQESLPFLLARLKTILESLGQPYEVLLVNDGSRDRSWEVIRDLVAQYPFVSGINMMRNYGQHNASLCGTLQAKHEIVVTMDDDLQHPPEEIPKLLAKLGEGFDVVYGYPKKMPHSVWRNLFSRITKRILAFVMRIKTVQEISAFRAFRSRLRRAFERYQNPGIILDVLLSWGTTRFASVEVVEDPRQTGRSNYSFAKLVSQAFLILTGYSTAPLRFTSWLGFAVTFFGVVVFARVIINYFVQGSIPGFTFLASIISIFSGAILFALGIIGEYLARIFDRSMDQPTYVISEVVINKDGTAMLASGPPRPPSE